MTLLTDCLILAVYCSFERWKRWMHLHFLLSFLCSPLSFVLFYVVKINFQFCYGNSSGCLAILFEMVSVLTRSSFITVFPFHEYLLWPIFFWWGLDILFFRKAFQEGSISVLSLNYCMFETKLTIILKDTLAGLETCQPDFSLSLGELLLLPNNMGPGCRFHAFNHSTSFQSLWDEFVSSQV